MSASKHTLERLPSRKLLRAATVGGSTLAIIGAGLCLYWVWYMVVKSDGVYDLSHSPKPFNGFVSLVLVVLGVAIAARARVVHERYYQWVSSGRVVGKDYRRIDDLSYSCDILVEGLTKAGELRVSRWPVSPTVLDDYKIGQQVTKSEW